MASYSLSSFLSQIAVLTIISMVLIFSSSPAVALTRRPFKKIYAFGDSYTDTGNTRSATGPSSFNYVSNLPYGQTFFHHPTNRYSDGRLVIDFVAQSLSLPYLPPYRDSKADRSYGVNFAVAGSTAIKHSFFVKNNLTMNVTPQSLGTQLVWFDRYLETVGCGGARLCDAAFEDALVWVGEIGANDYAYSFASSISSKTIQLLALKSISGFLEVLLSKGAKYVVVQGLPTTGCLTLSMVLAPEDDRDDLGCVGSANRQSYDHSTALQSEIQYLRRKFPRAVILYADYWNAYRSIVKNAKRYGFAEPFKVCCGSGGVGPYNFDVFATCGSPTASSCSDPARFINWDGVHLTEAMYKVVAESFLNGPFCHPPFNYLLSKKLNSTRG